MQCQTTTKTNNNKKIKIMKKLTISPVSELLKGNEEYQWMVLDEKQRQIGILTVQNVNSQVPGYLSWVNDKIWSNFENATSKRLIKTW